MPNSLGPNGLTIATAAEVLSNLENGVNGVPGYLTIFPGANVAPNSPDGNLLNIFTQVIVDTEELLQQIYNSMDPDQAIGPTLDARCAINGVVRMAGTYTQQPIVVTATGAATVQGLDFYPTNPFTVADSSGNQYQLVATHTFGGAGTATLTFQAVNIGPIQSTIGTITNIVTVTLNISSVNNASGPSAVGVTEETDAQLRIRRANSVANGSVGYLEGIESAILGVSGVTGCVVYENDTSGTVNGMPPHSIWCIVAETIGPGEGTAIATAIYNKKSPGCSQTNAGTGGAGIASLSGTSVSSISVGAAGSGYSNAPVVEISGGGGSGATAHATINGSGQITAFVVDSGGTGYLAAPSVFLNPNTVGPINFTTPSGQTIGIYYDVPISESFYFRAQVDVITGNAPNLAFLATQLALTTYSIGASASASALLCELQDLAPNCYISNQAVSTDNSTWLALVSPSGINYKFMLPSSNITLTT